MNTPLQDRTLPELADRRIDEIEDALFADIARDRIARRARRGRVWMGGAAAAAVVVVAAVIAPSVVSSIGAGSSGGTAFDAPVTTTDSGGGADGAFVDGTKLAEESAVDAAGDAAATDRDIITTASATVVVDDVSVAARTVGDAATARGGYVESMNVGTTDPQPMTEDGIAYDVYPYPYPGDGAWITVRVPADELTAMIDELGEVGEVTASSVNRQDVTEQTVDLEARIDATQASVDRLTELMGQASDLSDLIAAESALAERQALLESYQQQLESLEGMIELSTLSVSLTPRVEPVSADPAGFADGVTAGWNGLVATLNGIVIAIGFLIPWIAVLAVAGLIVWGVVRLVHRRRRGRDASDADATPRD